MTKSRTVNEYLVNLRAKINPINQSGSDEHKARIGKLYDKAEQALISLGNSSAAECVKHHALQQIDDQISIGIYNSLALNARETGKVKTPGQIYTLD